MTKCRRPRVPRLVGGLLLTAMTGLTAACGASSSTSPSTHASLPPPTVHLSAADSGRQVRMAVGGHLVVVLDSTYWTFHPVTPAGILRSDGGPTVVPRVGHCVPGQGCGTVTAGFVATHQGAATVEATRTTCGEALACSAGRGEFQVTVAVRAGTT